MPSEDSISFIKKYEKSKTFQKNNMKVGQKKFLDVYKNYRIRIN